MVDSSYADKCGELDYYKPSEHQNTIDFSKALEAYEANKSDTVEGINVLHDFVDWFWDSNVVDLKASWAESPVQLSVLDMFMNKSHEVGLFSQPVVSCRNLADNS